MSWVVVAGVALGLIGVWAVLVIILWLARPRDARLIEVMRVVPDVARLAWALVRDRTTPLGVRLALIGLGLWLVNPVDLVPEFVPVIGPLDDVVVTIIVLRYVRRRMGDTALRHRWPGTADGYRLLARFIGSGAADHGPGERGSVR